MTGRFFFVRSAGVHPHAEAVLQICHIKRKVTMKILILNGPNLNLLGRREPSVYGSRSFDEYFSELRERFAQRVELAFFQSNSEGALIDKIHEVGFDYDGIVLNAGAYTHTSLAIADAIRAVPAPVVELHISNVYAREEYRHRSLLAPACRGCICGFGLEGYALAVGSFLGQDQSRKPSQAKRKPRALLPEQEHALSIARDLRLQGDRLGDIADKLNRMGVLTPRGKQWSLQTVGKLLKK